MATTTTRRAYTMKISPLRGAEVPIMDSLWSTHEAVNKGTAAFGSWLLTLRGGLSVQSVFGECIESISEDALKDLQIMLSLSWLTVESAAGAPLDYVIATGLDNREERQHKVMDALESILKCQKIKASDRALWLRNCRESLTAQIREDAVWVNRNASFRDVCIEHELLIPDSEIWLVIDRFSQGKKMIVEPLASNRADSDDDGSANRAPVLAPSSSDDGESSYAAEARTWLSNQFGSGKKSDSKSLGETYASLTMCLEQIEGEGDSLSGIELFTRLAKTVKGTEIDKLHPNRTLVDFIKGLKSGRDNSFQVALADLPCSSETVSRERIKKLKELASKALEKINSDRTEQLAWTRVILKDVESSSGIAYRPERTDRIGEYTVIADHAARRFSSHWSWTRIAEQNRRAFSQAAELLESIPRDAREWLDAYCASRETELGSIDEFVINRRAVSGWREVLKAWSKCSDSDERILRLKELQSSNKIEKFGDINLFEALAADSAQVVFPEFKPDLLLNYVEGTYAIRRQKQFKVPSYRHPDPLLHPVFVDYGDSRWKISYGMQQRGTLGSHSGKVPKTPSKQPKPALHGESVSSTVKSTGGLPEITRLHTVELSLFDGHTISSRGLIWNSKRLVQDLDLSNPYNPQGRRVSRANRLGRIAAGATAAEQVLVAEIFDKAKWNGRLQAPRDYFERMARCRDNQEIPDKDKLRRLAELRRRIPWFLTLSLELEKNGPWLEYCDLNSLNPRSPHKELNANRARQNQLLLSRLPNLRILSVDLGVRHAAACAVWATLSESEFRLECKRLLQSGGCVYPADPSTFAVLERNIEQVRESRSQSRETRSKTTRTVYRRIGAANLDDGTLHPSSWARLDRQFLIKLAGEDECPRRCSDRELASYKELLSDFGVSQERELKQVDKVMANSLRVVAMGLKDQARIARIHFDLAQDLSILPGDRVKVLTREERIEHVVKTLRVWFDLAFNSRHSNQFARGLWLQHIEPLLGAGSEGASDSDESARFASCKSNKTISLLRQPAERLLEENSIRRVILQSLISEWNSVDKKIAAKLRALRNWILGKPNALVSKGSNWKVGGLSVARLNTVRALFEIQKAYSMRPRPENIRAGVPARRASKSLEKFGARILRVHEELRANRVKQLASRIVEAALGVGAVTRSGKSRKLSKRPTSPSAEPRLLPCHAIVIEDLNRYRPDEMRTRRENRQLLDWSSAKIRTALEQMTELNGLRLVMVQPDYTSRQDSRTGAPGARCEDVSADEFCSETSFWGQELKRLENSEKSRIPFAEIKDYADYLIQMRTKLLQTAGRAQRWVRVIKPGGPLFVSAVSSFNSGSFIQADLNAAANIGLRAVVDPDWTLHWWYLPTAKIGDQRVLSPERAKGSAFLSSIGFRKGPQGDYSVVAAEKQGKVRKSVCLEDESSSIAENEDEKITNLWSDKTGSILSPDQWVETPYYWNLVYAAVARNLTKGMV